MTESWPRTDHTPVRQNRWDEVPVGDRRPTVSVIVCHYEQPDDLARLLCAMADQRGPLDLLEVVVVDDGSAEAPDPVRSTGGIPVRVLRQADRGVRPGAARNLGVRNSRGEVLVFLDADTIPGPDTVARLAALPAATPDALTVGRRHHVDLQEWSPESVSAWLTGEAVAAPEFLDDPAWLSDGYRATRDLIDIDDRSYQWVIGAVMACSRRFFDLLGGFDESIDTYGGEDWDLAHRAYAAGAVLAHVAGAPAFHNGADWAARNGDRALKNDERLVLAGAIPGDRDALVGPFAPIVVRLHARSWDRDRSVATVADLLAQGGTAVRVAVIDPPAGLAAVVGSDSRIAFGAPSPSILERSRVQLDLDVPLLMGTGGLGSLTDVVRPGGAGRVRFVDDGQTVATVTSTRALARAQRWAHLLGGSTAALDALFGFERRVLPEPVRPVDDPVDLRTWFGR